MVELVIRGTEDLGKLARALKAVGSGALRRELVRAIRRGTRQFPQAVSASARNTLPRTGGFADLIAASRVSSMARLQGNRIGVRFTIRSEHNLRSLDGGRLSHPLYGNKGHWFTQTVPAGWLTKPIAAMSEGIHAEVSHSLKAFADKHLSN